jgi:hypothetical protein
MAPRLGNQDSPHIHTYTHTHTQLFWLPSIYTLSHTRDVYTLFGDEPERAKPEKKTKKRDHLNSLQLLDHPW